MSDREKIIVGIIIAVLVAGLGGYWFVVRPSNIKKACAATAANVADNGNPKSSFVGSQAFWNGYSGDYQLCLNSKGL
jgi:hypothetical protein